MRLTIVGVGPGDPELITIKGLRAIEAARIIFVPTNRDGSESLALRVAEPWIDATRQQVVELTLAMTRQSDEAEECYVAAAAQIAATFAGYAQATDSDAVQAVYLLLGDPLLYGTFAAIGRELTTRAPHIAIEVVPGITSFAATAARMQIVLGAGDERVAIVPATPELDAVTLRRMLTDCETLIVMKVGRLLPQLLDALDEVGVLDSTWFAERVGMPEEEIVLDVRTLRGQQRSYLSLLLVHHYAASSHRRTVASSHRALASSHRQRDSSQHAGIVYFIGAGPGAPDLITVRGQDYIAQADLILYADSLVQESVAQLARKPDVRVVGSSGMHLEQIVDLMVETALAGGIVARVHTGDPALYGAIQEQIAGLDAANILWEIVPGVTAAFAAAARLGASLTLPDMTQTLILSRIAGRTPMPQREELHTLAAHGASLVLYLSIGQIEQVVAMALASGGYTPQTPVAVVHKVTWPDEHMVVGTLADIADKVRAAGYTRHALIIISPALAAAQASAHQSKLYDYAFTHGFRDGCCDEATVRRGDEYGRWCDGATTQTRRTVESSPRRTITNVVVIAITHAGARLAEQLAHALSADTLVPTRFATKATTMCYDGSVVDEIRRCWLSYRTLVLIMASGIAVRAIAPMSDSKTTDPAIICMDEAGQSVIPLLGGHRAGANDMARRIAALTGGHAAITTASDVQGKPVLDVLGRAEGWKIDSASALTHASACLVNNQPVGVYVEPELVVAQQQVQTWLAQADNLVLVEYLDDLMDNATLPAGLVITHRCLDERYRRLLHKSVVVYPPVLVAGIGCREGTSSDDLHAALETTLTEHGVAIESVAALASIALKAKEAGLHRLAENLHLPLRFIDETEVLDIDIAQLSGTSAAHEKLGLPGVAEPCAIIAAGGGTLLAPRRKFANCTVALAMVAPDVAHNALSRNDATMQRPDKEPEILSDSLPQRTGSLALISIGPGDLAQMTVAAREALLSAEVVIGYHTYIELVQPLLISTQDVLSGPMRQELRRAEQALDLAAAGQRVALISSGDVGMYGMAGPVFEVLRQRGWQGNDPPVATYPGVSAFQAAAALVGAPINHDVCAISLSDLLTDWAVIEQRLWAAADGDFVVALYNPRSRKRDWQLARARDILLTARSGDTPVALIHNVTRSDESVTLTTLALLDVSLADMGTVVIVGNSHSYVIAERMATPRGYNTVASSRHIEDLSHRQSAFPLTLTNVHHALVVGGGTVGERKVRNLLDAGIHVRLISPDATPQLHAWAHEGCIDWVQRGYASDDIQLAEPEQIVLVFAATNQREINQQVALTAAHCGMLCNVADAPDEGTFHVPALSRGPGFIVAVSTIGESPSRAVQIRNTIAEMLNNDR